MNRDSTLGARFASDTPVFPGQPRRQLPGLAGQLPAMKVSSCFQAKGEFMAKRMILMLAVTALLIGALGFVKFRQVQSAIAGCDPFSRRRTRSRASSCKEHGLRPLGVIGTMEAVQGVTVSADLPGQCDGSTLIPARRCARATYWWSSTPGRSGPSWPRSKRSAISPRLNFDRMKQLVNEGVISRVEYDQATAAAAGRPKRNVGEIRATIERKTIRAPFSGRAGHPQGQPRPVSRRRAIRSFRCRR